MTFYMTTCHAGCFGQIYQRFGSSRQNGAPDPRPRPPWSGPGLRAGGAARARRAARRRAQGRLDGDRWPPRRDPAVRVRAHSTSTALPTPCDSTAARHIHGHRRLRGRSPLRQHAAHAGMLGLRSAGTFCGSWSLRVSRPRDPLAEAQRRVAARSFRFFFRHASGRWIRECDLYAAIRLCGAARARRDDHSQTTMTC